MPQLLFVLGSRSDIEARNLLNAAQASQDLPEGVKSLLLGTWLIDFPKCSPFFSMLVVAAEQRRLQYAVFEVATDSAWYQAPKRPLE